MFVLETIIFLLLVFFLLFLPGWFLLMIFFPQKKEFHVLEKSIVSFALSLVLIDFLFFLLSFYEIAITRQTSLIGITALMLLLGSVAFFRNRKVKNEVREKNKLFDFSVSQKWLIVLLLFLTFFIKTVYLSGTISPTSTDMGHHMYWAKEMSETGELPRYEGMPDFIIGEHIVFGLFNIIGKLSFFGAFPISLLYLFNLLGILATFILTLRIFRKKKVAILILFFLGVVFAISSPQAKFVSGGVIGNIIGNFLLPLSFYLYFRAFDGLAEKKFINMKSRRSFLALAVLVTTGLFFTHHLSSFVLLFSVLGILIVFLIFSWKKAKVIFQNIYGLLFSKSVIVTLLLSLIFFFFIFTPNYASFSAVDTAVGSPIKETRTGLSLNNIFSSVGELRVILGFLGIFILFWNFKKINFGKAVILGWALMLFVMATKPSWLFVDIPSNRIGSYLVYPFSVLAAFCLYFVFFKNIKSKRRIVGEKVLIFSLVFVLMSILTVGVYDSLVSFKDQKEDTQINQVFNASRFVAGEAEENDWLLKDHNYLTSDAWIKLFFMREYRYPLSRSYFKRYEDPTKPREMCTLYMISDPDSEEAQDCFQKTGVNLIMVNPLYDEAQFKLLPNFDKIYAGSSVGVFYRKK